MPCSGGDTHSATKVRIVIATLQSHPLGTSPGHIVALARMLGPIAGAITTPVAVCVAVISTPGINASVASVPGSVQRRIDNLSESNHRKKQERQHSRYGKQSVHSITSVYK